MPAVTADRGVERELARRLALFRENRRISLVEVTEIEESDASIRAICVLRPREALTTAAANDGQST